MLRKYPHWRRALDALHRAYGGYCAYLARYIEPVETPTADHFVALRNATDPMLAYTWSNYRLAHAFVNGVKKDIPNVLDPFEIEVGWFGIDFGTFETVAGPNAPDDRRAEIEDTIRLLHLDKPKVTRTRRRAAELYWHPRPGGAPLPLWSLEEDEPFLASELRRQRMLNSVDLASDHRSLA